MLSTILFILVIIPMIIMAIGIVLAIYIYIFNKIIDFIKIIFGKEDNLK